MRESGEAGRISRLCATLGRITESPGPGTVLRKVVEGARALTGALYAMITAVDESGGPREFVTSGLSTEEVHNLTNCLPDGLRLFGYLCDQEAPLWVEDFPAHLRSLGLLEEMALCRTFQGTPMRHGGAHVGNFFVGDKEGGRGLHRPGRGIAGALRLPGGVCGRERGGGSGGPARDLAGGGGG